jgi:hypothetical protein
MGFDPAIVRVAIEKAGPDSVDVCIDAIEQMSKDPPPSDSPEESVEEKLTRARERLAARQAATAAEKPKGEAESELDRRKEVQDSLETRTRLNEAKAKQEADLGRAKRIQDQKARKATLDQINARRSGSAGIPKPEAEAEAAALARTQSTPTSRGCTLKLIFPDGTQMIEPFKAEDPLGAVFEYVIRKVPRGLGEERRVRDGGAEAIAGSE